MERTAKGLAKLERMTKTLRHQEADRVPVSDFFWGSFLERWRRELGLPAGADIYRYYDLDWIATVPNMDPRIGPFEVLEETQDHIVVRTGFGSVIRKQFADPMPAFLEFETDSLEKMAAGDVAYGRDLLFSPAYWRRHFKPIVKAVVDECHAHGLPVIYHGCGNARRIFDDFIEIGVDVYNPLEAKAGFDVVELRRRYGHRIGFCGNMDVGTWAHASEEELKRVVLTKLNAAKGGGYVFQSDHSVPGNISGRNYDYVVRLVREYGRYPLRLGEYDLPDIR